MTTTTTTTTPPQPAESAGFDYSSSVVVAPPQGNTTEIQGYTSEDVRTMTAFEHAEVSVKVPVDVRAVLDDMVWEVETDKVDLRVHERWEPLADVAAHWREHGKVLPKTQTKTKTKTRKTVQVPAKPVYDLKELQAKASLTPEEHAFLKTEQRKERRERSKRTLEHRQKRKEEKGRCDDDSQQRKYRKVTKIVPLSQALQDEIAEDERKERAEKLVKLRHDGRVARARRQVEAFERNRRNKLRASLLAACIAELRDAKEEAAQVLLQKAMVLVVMEEGQPKKGVQEMTATERAEADARRTQRKQHEGLP